MTSEVTTRHPRGAPRARDRDRAEGTPSSAVRSLAIAGAHLAALWSFAVAQPLFDLLGRNAAFFAVRGSTRAEIVVFALSLALVVPAGLLLLVALASAVHDRARVGVQMLFVGVLVALVALQALNRTNIDTSRLLIPFAVVLGAAGAWIYVSVRPARSALTVLAAAPPLFLALFLFGTPVRTLLFPNESAAAASDVKSRTPVVMVVFDEFSSTSLMNGQREIDATRFPNFAALAGDATWFRNATTVHDGSVHAVPAILTGRHPKPEQLPVHADHPNNLFTLVGGGYHLRVSESITTLCPRALCRTQPTHRNRSAIASDATVVYLHVLLPRDLRRHLPSISDRWHGFREENDATPTTRARPAAGGGNRSAAAIAAVERAGRHSYDRDASFAKFVDSVRRDERPTLDFIHVLLPHTPWQYLPSGKTYLTRRDAGVVPGLDGDEWGAEPWPVEQAHQRYLLQLGYVDRLLGDLLARLRRTGVYDRSLIVVTADHGISFRPRDNRRTVTETNVQDIAFVPLFVKTPRQRVGRVTDRTTRTIDVLPTIAHALGVRVPWKIDGRSAFALAKGAVPGDLTVAGKTFAAGQVERRRRAALAQQLEILGAGGGWVPVFGMRSPARVIGRRAADFSTTSRGRIGAVLDETVLGVVDSRSPLLPAFVTGRLTGEDARARELIAVAVNGRIVAVTRSYADDDTVRFGAIAPESAFRAGQNRIEVFALAFASGRYALHYLGGTGGETFRLVDDRAGERLVSSGGTQIRVGAGAVDGHVDAVEVDANSVRFAGWAADLENTRVRERVVVFSGRRFVSSSSTPISRPDLGAALSDAGFDFTLPLDALTRGAKTPEIRVFGVIGQRASELIYPPDYAWRPRLWSRGPRFELTNDETGPVLTAENGRSIPVRPGAVAGHVDVSDVGSRSVRFSGWAADVVGGRVRDRVVVFSGDRFVFSWSRPAARPDLGPGLADAGFDVTLPLDVVLGGEGRPEVRVFAIVGGVASELLYPKNYRWAARS